MSNTLSAPYAPAVGENDDEQGRESFCPCLKPVSECFESGTRTFIESCSSLFRRESILNEAFRSLMHQFDTQ